MLPSPLDPVDPLTLCLRAAGESGPVEILAGPPPVRPWPARSLAARSPSARPRAANRDPLPYELGISRRAS